MHALLPLPLFALLLASISTANASSGDRSPAFQSCLQSCSSTCTSSPPLPLALRLTAWTCTDNCAYECMHALESTRLAQGEKPQQYYGKWPFPRFLGAQEPVSVLASIANGYMHLLGLRLIRRRLPSPTPPSSSLAGSAARNEGNPLKSYLEVYAYVGMNAWLWSTVFHTRDTPNTERLDYFSAALALLYSIYYTLVRLFHLYLPSRTRVRRALGLMLTAVFAGHVSYLTWIPQVVSGLPRFDYAYNMTFAVAIGLAHNILWLLSQYAPRLFPAPRSRPSSKPLLFVLLTMASMSLELLDFPPVWGLVDAHAAWHLSTVGLVGLWYGWLVDDAASVGTGAGAGESGGRGKPA